MYKDPAWLIEELDKEIAAFESAFKRAEREGDRDRMKVGSGVLEGLRMARSLAQRLD